MPVVSRRSRPGPAAAPRRGASAHAVPSGPVFVTRQVHFNAAHRLENRSHGRGWNARRFGLCSSPNWHGHNYVLEATVAGEPDPETGYVIDLMKLKAILHRSVADRCDHRNLNRDVGFLRGINPTTENLVIAFWREVEPRVRPARLHRLRLYETPRNYVDYFGPGGGR